MRQNYFVERIRPYIAVIDGVYESLFIQFAPDIVQMEEEVVKTLHCTIQQRVGCGFQTELNIYKR